MNRHAVSAMAPGAALTALAMFQPWLEQRMLTHMLVELPLLFLLGAWMAPVTLGHGPAWLRRVNAGGLTGLLLAWLVSSIWMLPLALDAAVLGPAIGWLKVASCVLAGWLARLSARAAHPAALAFFAINWGWMTATAGLLYQEVPQRLCNTYLLDDQAWTGMGLVVLAVLGISGWMAIVFRRFGTSSPSDPTRESPPLPSRCAANRS